MRYSLYTQQSQGHQNFMNINDASSFGRVISTMLYVLLYGYANELKHPKNT